MGRASSERAGDSGEMLSANMVDSTRQAREQEERGTEMKTENFRFLWIFWERRQPSGQNTVLECVGRSR